MENGFEFIPQTNEKHVIVEILGGDVDGLVLDSKNPADQEKIAHVLIMTNNGEIGQGFKGAPVSVVMNALDGKPIDPKKLNYGATHFYWVRERLEEGESVLIRLFYEIKVHDIPKPPPE